MDWQGSLATWGAITFAACLAFAVCAGGKLIAEHLGLFDEPDGIRKKHRSAVPLVGGLAILLPLAICISAALALHVNYDRHLQLVLVLCSLGAGIVGFADDQTELRAPTRLFFLMIFAAMALVVDPRLFPTLLRWGTAAATPVSPAAFAALFVVAAVGIVNAVNMADGCNGIVGSMYAVWSLCLLIVGSRTTHFAAVAIFGSSLVFLAFNLRGKLFLGDCGSYGVTFAIGIMAAAAHANGRVPLETLSVWFALPVMDCLRLIATRILNRRSPFSPDREHLHHLLQDRFGHGPALAIYVGAIASTSLLATLEPAYSWIYLVLLALGFVVVTWPRRSAASVEASLGATSLIATASGSAQAQSL